MPGDFLTTVTNGLGDVALVPLEHGSSLDHWAQGEFFPALNERVRVVMGMAAFMLIVGVPTFLALQYWSKNYTVPATVLVLSGGAVLGMMPPVVARIGWIIILLAGALGLFGLLWAVIR
jgi:hypothetical protein